METEKTLPEVATPASPQDPTPGALVVQDGTLSEKFVEASSKQIELRSRLLTTALKALKPHDIQDFDGKPYVEGEGAARIMAVIRGFKVGEAKFSIENIHPHYFVECQIPMEFMGATTVALGDCSTADPFFVGKDGQSGQYGKHLARTGSEAMAGRLILGDAKKKARENAISRGVTELLGLKGLSWDDLGKLGFSRSGAGSSIGFKKGSQGGEIKTGGIVDAVSAPIGSSLNITGDYVSKKVKTVAVKGKETKITGYELTDGKNTILVQFWGEDQISPSVGNKLFCANVKISDFRGERQYTAESVDPVIDEGGKDEEK